MIVGPLLTATEMMLSVRRREPYVVYHSDAIIILPSWIIFVTVIHH